MCKYGCVFCNASKTWVTDLFVYTDVWETSFWSDRFSAFFEWSKHGQTPAHAVHRFLRQQDYSQAHSHTHRQKMAQNKEDSTLNGKPFQYLTRTSTINHYFMDYCMYNCLYIHLWLWVRVRVCNQCIIHENDFLFFCFSFFLLLHYLNAWNKPTNQIKLML